MMQTAAWGRLGSDPKQIQTQSGTSMAAATLAVDVADPREGEGAAPLWLGVLAFGKQADLLLKHSKGDCVSVAGRVQRNTFETRDSKHVEQLQVVAETVISAKTARPGGGKRRDDTGGRQARRQDAAQRSQAPLYHDDVPEWAR